MAMITLYALWCGLCWLLRGGKFGAIFRALFRREPGTTVTRISCAILMAAPLGFVDPAYALLAISIYVAMTLGYFKESMGVKYAKEVAWMSAWGLTVLLVSLSPLAYFVGLSSLAYSALGLLAGPIYLGNRLLGRRLGLDWTERSEILFGVAAGSAIALGTGAF
jgi:hypothetical protein